MRPELLQHPNIPKPMHGLNPRTIKGKEWWDETRFEVQKKQNYCCAACGIKKTEAWPNRWLECHEDYEIDYVNGVMEIKEFVALCPACHKFIHSGRLDVVIDVSDELKEKIIQHGWDILSRNKLYVSAATHQLIFGFHLPEPDGFIMESKARSQGFGFGKDWCSDGFAPWKSWRMILEGKEYKPLFPSMAEWKSHYNR